MLPDVQLIPDSQQGAFACLFAVEPATSAVIELAHTHFATVPLEILEVRSGRQEPSKPKS